MAVNLAMNGMVHRALLRELDRIADLVAAGQAEAARKRYAFFSEQLHLHHETEDEFLWSAVRGRADEEQVRTIDAMEAEHEQLHKALDLCDEDFAGELRESTATDLAGLRLLMAAHFAHEEATGEPILEQYLTAEDLKVFNEANKKSPHAMMVFPWIADGGTDEDQKVYDVLPGPVRLFLKPVMQRKYAGYFN